MNGNFPARAVWVFLLVLLVGCGHKTPGINAQIKESVQAMAQAKSASSAPLQQLNEAVAAYQNGNYQEAVTKLQNMHAHTEMNGEQLLALNQAISAVMNDLYMRAAKGDDQAQAAIKEYQRLQNRL